ncbi:MAG: 7-cyano-7-deazaguanine synthase [Methanobacterium sp.]|nr:7-cyano-7-deazaguanine synthase [Methanobacterium sp.]
MIKDGFDLNKDDLLSLISSIRRDIGHEDIKPDILDVIFNPEKSELLIITSDRPEKSLVIGKGGWVVGRLKEELKVNQIHVEAYTDILLRRYRMELALKKLWQCLKNYDTETVKPLKNLLNLLEMRIQHPYKGEDVLKEFSPEKESTASQNSFKAVVALSGGVDSSFALIIARMVGFNPLAVTINPGDIILPRYYQEKVENLTRQLSIEHRYLDVDMAKEIEGALEGRYHPCGRCSRIIEETVLEYTRNEGIPFIIFGDLLATGAQSLTSKGEVLRINLPAMLSATKGETKALAGKYGVTSTGGYGCPLLGEVKKKYGYMNRYSVSRILRETRAGVLEPGEALELIMSLFKK